jgi:hypothetical protein
MVLMYCLVMSSSRLREFFFGMRGSKLLQEADGKLQISSQLGFQQERPVCQRQKYR